MTDEVDQRAIVQSAAGEGSYWPIVLAVALTLALAGLVVNIAISLFGVALCFVAIVAWSLQRFQGPGTVDGAPIEAVHLPALGPGEAEFEPRVAIAMRPGWWGLVWFIASEAVFFGNLIVAYLYLRLSSPEWPPQGMPHFDLLPPSLNTVILLLSGLPAYYGHRAIKKGDLRGLQIGVMLAALLGAIFLGRQVQEYFAVGFTPQTNALAAGFFVLTGFHGAHVVAGIGLLLGVFVLSLQGRFTAQHNFAVEVASTYWHFVDIVWIFLFAVLYVMQ